MESLSDQYFIKALDHYPRNLTETLESLNYALSHNEDNAYAHFLMGRIYAEQIKDRINAEHYFQRAIACDISQSQFYPYLISAQIEIGKFEEALKTINYALTLSSSNKGWVYWLQGFCFESMEEYEKAISSFKEAKKNAFNTYFLNDTKDQIKRVKGKLHKSKKKKKKGKNKKK
ncbi:MAG: hypothetical protein AAF487_08445 [Bacteroidota bacterium]